MEVWIGIVTGLASFAGTWAASQVHMKYLRRDVDHAHKRIDKLEERDFHEKRI